MATVPGLFLFVPISNFAERIGTSLSLNGLVMPQQPQKLFRAARGAGAMVIPASAVKSCEVRKVARHHQAAASSLATYRWIDATVILRERPSLND